MTSVAADVWMSWKSNRFSENIYNTAARATMSNCQALFTTQYKTCQQGSSSKRWRQKIMYIIKVHRQTCCNIWVYLTRFSRIERSPGIVRMNHEHCNLSVNEVKGNPSRWGAVTSPFPTRPSPSPVPPFSLRTSCQLDSCCCGRRPEVSRISAG